MRFESVENVTKTPTVANANERMLSFERVVCVLCFDSFPECLVSFSVLESGRLLLL